MSRVDKGFYSSNRRYVLWLCREDGRDGVDRASDEVCRGQQTNEVGKGRLTAEVRCWCWCPLSKGGWIA